MNKEDRCVLIRGYNTEISGCGLFELKISKWKLTLPYLTQYLEVTPASLAKKILRSSLCRGRFDFCMCVSSYHWLHNCNPKQEAQTFSHALYTTNLKFHMAIFRINLSPKHSFYQADFESRSACTQSSWPSRFRSKISHTQNTKWKNR